MRDSLDSCENVTFYVKTATFTFWATFGKFGLLFIPTSGHTDHILRMRIRRDERQKREGEKNKKVSTGKGKRTKLTPRQKRIRRDDYGDDVVSFRGAIERVAQKLLRTVADDDHVEDDE